MPHDPAEVTQRMDHFGEQRGEGSVEEATAEMLLKEELVEEAMDLDYQPGSDGEEDSDSTDGPHSPGHTGHHSSSSTTAGAASAGQTSAHLKARISTCQRMPWMPSMKPQKRVREGAVNPASLTAR